VGVNNRARRAAKRRERSSWRAGDRQGGQPSSSFGEGDRGDDDRFVAAALVSQAVDECAADHRAAAEQAALLGSSGLPPSLVAATWTIS